MHVTQLVGSVRWVAHETAVPLGVHGDNKTLHCAKSCRPFELFANENYELWNEAKMNVTFERGSA